MTNPPPLPNCASTHSGATTGPRCKSHPQTLIRRVWVALALSTLAAGCVHAPVPPSARQDPKPAPRFEASAIPAESAVFAGEADPARAASHTAPQQPAAAASGAALSASASSDTTSDPDGERAFNDPLRREALVQEIVSAQDLPSAWVRDALAQARLTPRVRELIKPTPPAQRNWRAYLARFTDNTRINAGVAFVREHRAWFEMAEKRWGVPIPILAGVIGVETVFGRVQGNFPVLDALATLSLSYPQGPDAGRDRSRFFRSELGAYLRWARNEKLEDLRAVRGSYAGAIGMSQFMPSNILKLAADLDENGHIDLRQSPADAIGSVARYLSFWGWKPDAPLYFDVQLEPDAQLDALTASDLLPTLSMTDIMRLGARPLLPQEASSAPQEARYSLIRLPNAGDAPDYVLGGPNFYVVTRYNHSAFYAMAVIKLSEAIAARLTADNAANK